MMKVSCFEVYFVTDSDFRLTMVVKARYCSDKPVDGVFQHDSAVLFKTPYVPYDNSFARIANLCTPQRFAGVLHSDPYDPLFWSKDVKSLYQINYGFVYADGIKAMKAALDFYDIAWDYHSLGLDDLPI